MGHEFKSHKIQPFRASPRPMSFEFSNPGADGLPLVRSRRDLSRCVTVELKKINTH